MLDHTFRVCESSGNFDAGVAWTDAHLARGRGHLSAGRGPEALIDFEQALVYPKNLQVDPTEGPSGRETEVNYWIGTAQHALEHKDQARQYWGLAATDKQASLRPDSDAQSAVQKYYQAMACQALGQAEPAREKFTEVFAAGRAAIATVPSEIKPFAAFGQRASPRRLVADAHFLIGLGNRGLNKRDAASQEFAAALATAPDHLGAKLELIMDPFKP